MILNYGSFDRLLGLCSWAYILIILVIQGCVCACDFFFFSVFSFLIAEYFAKKKSRKKKWLGFVGE